MNKMKTFIASSMSYLTIILALAFPLFTNAQFAGDYAPENWTFTSQDLSGTPSDGTIDLTNMPMGFTMSGNDDDLSGANSLYAITVAADGTIKFRWSYTTDDDDPSYDPAGYKLNSTVVQLTNSTGPNSQSGEIAVSVTAGDVFSFFVDGTDACCGRGHLTIEAFSTADNTPPTLNSLSDIISDVDPGQIDVNLEGITAGILESSQTITITATSSNTSVVPNPTITYTSPDATGTLSFTPEMGAFGDATITVNVMDDGGTANGSVDNIDVSFNVSIASNFPPEINPVGDIQAQINEAISVALSGISAGTGETQTITVGATSSNQSVIADEDIDITYTSPNATGTLDLTPASNVSGETMITVTVSDDGGTANNGQNQTVITFMVTIDPNGQPTVNAIDDLNLFVDATEQTVNLSGIGDGDNNVDQTITVNASSDNTSLIPDPVVTYTSPGATGTLTFTPVEAQFGTATITVTVGDNAGTSNGGLNEITETFIVNVSSNYQPEIDPISNIIIGINEPNRMINLTGINAGVITDTEVLSVAATSSNTDIINMDGIQVDYTDPNTTGTITLTPVSDALGETTITVTVSDDAGTANGGVNEIMETFIVRVEANNAPTIDQLSDIGLDINAAEQTINLTGITAGESSDYQTLTVTASSDNTSLIPNPTVTYTSDDATGSIAFTPEMDATGTAVITVTVTDNGGTLGGGVNETSTTFEVSVTGNQPPTLNLIGDVDRTDTSPFTINLSGITDGTGFDQNLTLTATSDNPTIIPNPTVNYTNGDGTGSLDFVPTGFGDAVITVTLMDDGGTDNGGVDTYVQTFNIHLGENTPPDISDWDSGNLLDDEPYYFNNGQGDQAILLNVGDADHTVTSITAVANNPAFADVVSVNYLPGNFIGGIIFSPVSGQVGEETFVISAQDDGGTANNGIDTYTVTVTAIFTEPTEFTSEFTSGNSDQYDVVPFTVNESGVAYIESFSDSYDGFDNVSFQLYETAFNELSQGENRLASGNKINYVLEKDKQYVLVTYNESLGDGSSNNAIGLVSGEVSFGYLPNLAFIADVSFDEDQTFSVSLEGISDGGGGTNDLSLSANGSDASAFQSFDFTNNNDGTGSMLITPSADYNGTSNLTVTVTNSEGNTFDRTFEVTINPVNDAPVLATGDQMVDEQAELSFMANATDVDLNTLTYSIDANSVSNGMSIDSSTGAITWTPDEDQDGTYQVTITANDGSLDGTETITVTVAEVNVAPVLSAIDNQMGAERTELTFTASASDADLPANTLEFSLDANSVSDGMVINASTGVFSWTPTVTQAGNYTVEVTVSDGALSDTQSFSISVENVLGVSTADVIEVYPNPTTDLIKVGSNEVMTVVFYDLNGAKVLETSNQNQINVSSLNTGTYVLQLINAEGKVLSTNRIIKR